MLLLKINIFPCSMSFVGKKPNTFIERLIELKPGPGLGVGICPVMCGVGTRRYRFSPGRFHPNLEPVSF